MKIFPMIDMVCDQIDEVTRVKRPNASSKYPAQSGHLRVALYSALSRLTEEQRASWLREHERVIAHLMQMEVQP